LWDTVPPCRESLLFRVVTECYNPPRDLQKWSERHSTVLTVLCSFDQKCRNTASQQYNVDIPRSASPGLAEVRCHRLLMSVPAAPAFLLVSSVLSTLCRTMRKREQGRLTLQHPRRETSRNVRKVRKVMETQKEQNGKSC